MCLVHNVSSVACILTFVGARVGDLVGDRVGAIVGAFVGDLVGTLVGTLAYEMRVLVMLQAVVLLFQHIC